MEYKTNKNEKIIYLDHLPRHRDGRNKGKIDWEKCIGYNIKGIYNGDEFEIKIIDYQRNKKKYLTIFYRDKFFDIVTDQLSTCSIGRILGKRTSEFKVEIGTIFKDDKRDLTITDREYRRDKDNRNRKYYKYTCNRCGWIDGWIKETDILNKTGYACCANKIVVEHINDIPTTAPWMVKYFQGGYDEAKLYTHGSNQKIYPICPDCGRIKDKKMPIYKIHSRNSIGCYCSDNISIPNKFFYAIISQLKQLKQVREFGIEKSFIWSEKRFYDGFINNEILIEMHGEQHYTGRFSQCLPSARTLQEEQENDKLKKQLALDNGIKEENYIVIDCRHSEMEWIKENVLKSRLSEIFDLKFINWNKIREFICRNLVKEVCEIWNNSNARLSTVDIAKITGLNRSTITEYLKQGKKLGWCNYDPKEESKKSKRELNKKGISKPIEIFKDNISLGVFPSCAELIRCSEKEFGVKFHDIYISQVCNGKKKQYKGFTFKYIEEPITYNK
jgi:transposase